MSVTQQPATPFGALEASPHPTFVVSDEARVVFANEAARRRFGAASDDLVHADRRVGSVIGCVESERPGGCGLEKDCARCVLHGSVLAALGGELVQRDVAAMKLRDGSGQVHDLTLLVSATAVRQGIHRRVVVVLEPGDEDVVEARLRQELEATRALLDAVPVPVIVKGPERKYVFFNREAAKLMGRDASEVLGKVDTDFFSPEVSRAHWAEDDRVLATGQPLEVEELFDGMAGRRRFLRVRKTRGASVRGEPLLIATLTDLTELKQAQLALEESRQLVADGLDNLRGVMEATDASIFAVDRQYRYTSFNRAHAATMRQIYGAEVVLGRPFLEFQTVAEDWTTAKVNLDRALAGEEFLVEAYSGDAGRSRRYFEIGHSPVRAGDGTVIGAAVFSRDATKRRLAEEALRDSEEKLRQAHKMEAVGQLAGGVAHDFNNLLTVILASAEMGLVEAPPEGPLRELLEEIRGAGARAQGLTRQLLAFSRRQVLQPRVVDLNATIRDVERLLVRLLGEEVVVRTQLDPGLHCVFIDPGQLEQVILNLAVNGRDAMTEGGTLSIETADVVLDAEYAERHAGAAPGPQIMLAISDTGIGMDAATLERAFDPFFTTKPKGKGTGLGLSTVYGVVKQSGGSIWVQSEPGRGTTFKVYLPRATAEIAQVAPPEAVRLRARPGDTILVVEDDEQVRRAAVRCLERLGYQVASANCLRNATRLVDQGRTFSALLTDVVMAGGSGLEVARLVSARCPAIHLVFMSGYTDEAIASHGALPPGALFLEKPFTPYSLGRKIREALDQAGSAQVQMQMQVQVQTQA